MNEYVKLVSEKTGESFDSTLIRMKKIKKLFGISYKEYYNNNLFDLSQGMLEKEALRLQRRKARRKEAFENAIKSSGLSRHEILEDLSRISAKGIIPINIMLYDKFQMYSLNEEKLEETLNTIKYRDSICKELKKDLELIDEGKMQYADIELKLEELRDIVRSLMNSQFFEKLKAMYIRGREHIEEDSLEEIFVDMDITRMLLGFTYNEYLSFHFETRDLQERRTFMTNKERMIALRKINDDISCNLLDDKAECYKIFKKKFGRKQILVKEETDYRKFKRFCFGKKSFVKKEISKSMGKGIEPVYLDGDVDLKKIMKRFIDESDGFVAEKMIKQHPFMASFNGSSVNTVRVETFFDGENVKVVDSFFRVGQNGDFVDNAGAGGIFVDVDIETGSLCSDGIDEFGRVYVTHPQSGKHFRGNVLQKWDKALKLVKYCGSRVPGVTYIGWDLAYTNRGKWIIVEGNAKPQIICNQASKGRGLKCEFIEKAKI